MAERLLRQPRILFRVDGGAAMGMGHVYRSLAIADACATTSRAEIAFLMSAEPRRGPRTVVSAPATRCASWATARLEALPRAHPRLRPRDPHQRPARARRRLPARARPPGATTVNLVDTLDDLETTEHYAQVIVSVMNEDRETPEGFYGGPAYAILRSSSAAGEGGPRATRAGAAELRRERSPGPTLKAARALAGAARDVEVVAVAGPAFSYRREFEALAPRFGRRVRLINEAGGHIADLMLEADVVVGSGGMSVYEIAALGTPGHRPRARTRARTSACASSPATAPWSTSASGPRWTRPPSRAAAKTLLRRCGPAPGDERARAGARGRPGREPRRGARAEPGRTRATDRRRQKRPTMERTPGPDCHEGPSSPAAPASWAATCGGAARPRRHRLRPRQPLDRLHREHRAPEGRPPLPLRRSTA